MTTAGLPATKATAASQLAVAAGDKSGHPSVPARGPCLRAVAIVGIRFPTQRDANPSMSAEAQSFLSASAAAETLASEPSLDRDELLSMVVDWEALGEYVCLRLYQHACVPMRCRYLLD